MEYCYHNIPEKAEEDDLQNRNELFRFGWRVGQRSQSLNIWEGEKENEVKVRGQQED